ncbi:MAG: hypothetical protein ABII13_05565 [Patescibacteria group bacterium]|nr:hypothetical protein [Patescibacteria group bacterium]MBU2508809.1 hypothetical protein [Patescibacteria group bacterium]
MLLSIYIAKVFGLFLVIAGLAMLYNKKDIHAWINTMLKEKSMVICHGAVALLVGLLLVNVHNVWVKDWTVLITIFGWILLLKGVFSMFVPSLTQKMCKVLLKTEWYTVGLIIMLIIGLFLSYKGFAL